MDTERSPAQQLHDLVQPDGLTLATMESCTGGLIASMLTDVEGAGYFLGGAVTYHLDTKFLFGVPPDLVERYGVVSAEVAACMAERAAGHFGSDCGLGVTGVAGPGPEDGIAAGTAFAAASLPGGKVVTRRIRVEAEREAAKAAIARETIRLLIDALHARRTTNIERRQAKRRTTNDERR